MVLAINFQMPMRVSKAEARGMFSGRHPHPTEVRERIAEHLESLDAENHAAVPTGEKGKMALDIRRARICNALEDAGVNVSHEKLGPHLGNRIASLLRGGKSEREAAEAVIDEYEQLHRKAFSN
jgi:hypothetical protein